MKLSGILCDPAPRQLDRNFNLETNLILSYTNHLGQKNRVQAEMDVGWQQVEIRYNCGERQRSCTNHSKMQCRTHQEQSNEEPKAVFMN